MKPTMRNCLTARLAFAVIAAPLAFAAIAFTAPAAAAGGYGRDTVKFSITIGGYGSRGPAFDYGYAPRRYAPRRYGPRHYGPRGHQRDYVGPRQRGGPHRRGYARPRHHDDGYRNAPYARRYGRSGVGYGCYRDYRGGYRVTVCRDAYGKPFIVGRY